MKEILIKDIIEFLKEENEEFEFHGSELEYIDGFSSITNYKTNSITWIKNEDIYLQLKDKLSEIKLIVLPNSLVTYDIYVNRIVTSNPKKIFFSILKKYFYEEREYKIGKYNTIAPNVKMGNDISIGNCCTIEEDVEIGDGTIIFNNVDIRKGTKIGKNCIIESCSVIGGDGFGYSESEDKTHMLVPHFGNVIIGDDVHIGSSVCIDRGTIDDTVINNNIKIDNLYQISHNVVIGENTMITGGTGIGGSVKIGKNCFISGFAVKNQLTVGDNSFIARGSVVLRNVKENTMVFGYPARSYGEYEKNSSHGLVIK